MKSTNADNFSLLASLVGFGIAIYAILTQPVQVDSARPTGTRSESKVEAAEPAFARLWDDPFAVYPEENEARLLQPLPPAGGDTLYLIVPTKTEQYEEDRENRIRTRYAIQRALIDQGFAAEPGNLMSTLELAPPSKLPGEGPHPPVGAGSPAFGTSQKENSDGNLRVPIQFFIQRPLQARLFKGSNGDGFTSVAVIWLPDVYAWQRTEGAENRFLDVLIGTLKRSIAASRAAGVTTEQVVNQQRGRDRWVFLGPSDSDGLAFFHKYPPYLSRENDNLSVAPYRATIAEPILNVLPGEKSTSPSPAEFKPIPIAAAEAQTHRASIRRLNNCDDIVCAELLRAIQTSGSLPPHPQTINVTVFAEWDTLYGRALAETFAALADLGGSRTSDDPSFYPALVKDLGKGLLAHRPPMAVTAGRIQVTVIPYLRGLDGASSLYRDNYGKTSETGAAKSKMDEGSRTPSNNVVEAAEGTTQFDYIRRLTGASFTHPVPLWPQANRPDAVVIFGTDIYDKLVLLEFLRQQLRNCLYMTTDLDALYWHPHYLRFTRDLIVASAFPLQMSTAFCGARHASNAICAPVEFRDSYQSAMYLVVTRCLQSSDQDLEAAPFDFTPDSFLYRIGNTKPLPILANFNGIRSGGSPKPTLKSVLGGIGGRIKGLLEPIAEGTSPFWPFALQITVIGMGLYSLRHDVPRRMLLSRETSDELWAAALALVPSDLRLSVTNLRTKQIWPKWHELPLRRPKRQGKSVRPIQRAPISSEEDIQARTEKIRDHYGTLLNKATTKVEVVEIALCLLSDLFSLRPKGEEPSPEKEATQRKDKGKSPKFNPLGFLQRLREKLANYDRDLICEQSLASEVQPFYEYIRADLTSSIERSEEVQKARKADGGGSILKFLHFWYRLFPSYKFILVGLVSVVMLAAICLQPVPFLVGPTTFSYHWRVVFWLVSVIALLVTFSLFHRTCYEQHRFRILVEALEELVPNQELGISNRQLVAMLAKASEPVANLTMVPSAMVFLIYASHLHPLGGVPMAEELLLLLGLSLLAMLYAYTRLRGAALAARAAVLDAYEREKTDAVRLIARLQSYADAKQPWQDDESTLIEALKRLLRGAGTTPSDALREMAVRIKEPIFRFRLCGYLQSLIQRDQTFVKQLGEMRTGVLAPLLTNPVTAALMIPLGGAGGLSVIEWIVSNAR
jgi:hypothetical protein